MTHKTDPEPMVMITETNEKDQDSTIVSSESIKPDLESEILDCIANSSAIFKSQQKNDPDLTYDEKRTIAREILNKSHSKFLAKFGDYLKPEYLSYFHNAEDYEVRHHTKRLERYFDKNRRQIDVKNRRYQALKILVEKGEYFSETEMMKRNPLLYDHLIGQYLTEEEKKKRDNIDTTNITFVNLLLESIERDRQRNFKKDQEEAENQVIEEYDSDEDWNENEEDRQVSNSHWGEMSSTVSSRDEDRRDQKLPPKFQKISTKERQVLREEFVTHMYESFLNGEDVDFDYSTVDDNETYDNINIRTEDEQEKYFDSESPETVLMENVREENDSEEDELDVYMRSLKECTTNRQQTKESPTQYLL